VRGSFGLVIGLAIGAGAMYLVLRPPWEHRAQTVRSDGPPVVIVNDAGVAKPKPKQRRSRPAGSAGVAQGDPEPEEIAPLRLVAADRALEWRGDDVALPAQNLDMAGKPGGHEARGLDDGEINATINSQAGGVKDCVVQGATNTDLRAEITLKLLVDGTGRVTRSRVHAPRYLLEHGLLGCAQRALGRIRFPATGGATIVTLPVNLG
jgi:hypothetical protein